MSKPENTAPKQRGGFRPGVSGNPAGKPKGARNKTTLLAEKMMADDAAEIIRAVIDGAKAGDMSAAKMILDRVVPIRKGAPVALDLPRVETAGDVAAAMRAVIAAMGEGELSPDEAATVAGVLEARRKAIETAELEERIAELESRK